MAGVTSNPTIFQQAIAKSSAYRTTWRAWHPAPADDKTVFETLAIADIQAAADVLRPVYDAAGGHDGFVSLEVAPDLAYDTAATIAEGAPPPRSRQSAQPHDQGASHQGGLAGHSPTDCRRHQHQRDA